MHLHFGTIYWGPNPYSRHPVVTAMLTSEADGPGLVTAARRMRELFPHWLAVMDENGSTASPLKQLAELLVAWALAALNDVRGAIWAAGSQEEFDNTQPTIALWVGFHHPEITQRALTLALEFCLRGANDAHFTVEQDHPALREFWGICRQHHPDYQANIILTGADKLGLSSLSAIPGARVWQVGWGWRGKTFFESASNADGFVGHLVAKNKTAGKAALINLGLPVAHHVVLDNARDVSAATRQVGFPCAVKPLDLSGGKGVTAGLRSNQAVIQAFHNARAYSNGPVMIEAHIPGDDHRLLVIKGKLLATIRRRPSYLLGDGRRCIRELIDEANQSRPPADHLGRSLLRRIVIDDSTTIHLANLGLALDTVPAAGQSFPIRSNANVSTGGISDDVSAITHPSIRQMAEAIATTLGLHAVGLDYLTTDISRPWQEVGGAFIEINTTPGLDVGFIAGLDQARMTRALVGDDTGRIPVVLIVVPAAEVELSSRVLQHSSCPPNTGWVCGPLVRLGQLSLVNHGMAQWRNVHTLLRHRSLHKLVIVTESAELLNQGLPVDQFSTIYYFGDHLPVAWQTLIEKSCTQFHRQETLPEGRLRQVLLSELLSEAQDETGQ